MLRLNVPPTTAACHQAPAAQRPSARWPGLGVRLAAMAAALFWWVFAAGTAAAQVRTMTGKLVDDVTIKQQPGAQVPLDLWFHDSEERPVKLREFFRGRPVILNLVYYRCPRLCKMTTAGLLRTLRVMELKAGQQFDILTISFNPRETASDARAARQTALSLYGQSSAEDGWHFLLGEETSIDPLLRAVGFQVAYDGDLDQYAHAAGLVILTPEGRVSRYLHGVEFASRDLRLALVEASANQIGTVTDQIMLFCYQYNPKIGKYSFAVHSLLKGMGICTVLVLGGSIAWLLRRERIARRQPDAEGLAMEAGAAPREGGPIEGPPSPSQ